ncbi:unnamed protein product [Schistosoma rodhaini]|nr:unnamed protein product [Schistosoma rodhaini]
MDITYSWCIICLINLLLNGKLGQAQEDNYTEDSTTDPTTFDNTTVTSTTTEFTNKPKVENSTTDGTTYTTTPSHFSTSTSTNDGTFLKISNNCIILGYRSDFYSDIYVFHKLSVIGTCVDGVGLTRYRWHRISIDYDHHYSKITRPKSTWFL